MVLYRKHTAEIMKHYLRLRHQLLPYLYTMNVALEEGAPLVSPMYYFYQKTKKATMCQINTSSVAKSWWSLQNQWTRIINLRKFKWFPEGKIIDFFTGRVWECGAWYLPWYQSIPVFAKEGAIVPLDGSGVKMGVDLPEVIDCIPRNHHSFEVIGKGLDGARCINYLWIDGGNSIIRWRRNEASFRKQNHRVHVQGAKQLSLVEERRSWIYWWRKMTVNPNEAFFQVLKNASLPYLTKISYIVG